MSDPVVTRPNTPLDPIQVEGNGSSEHPTAMMYSNAGILFLGLGALFFCLRELEALFLLSIFLILLLALFNLWTLAKWRRWWPRDPVPTTGSGLTASGTGGQRGT